MTPNKERVSVNIKHAGDSEILKKNLKALVRLLAQQTALDLKRDNDNLFLEGGAS
ncbi:MAG: hypothetical protein ABJH63_18660 [Rhizobiaceae bacterium]